MKVMTVLGTRPEIIRLSQVMRRLDEAEPIEQSVGKAYGDILAKSEAVMLDEKPDAVLILGDTNSAIAAIMAKRMHIPVFHMEAGNRSFDHNVPEEVNRRIVDHTADFNLVYTEHARRNLLAEGLPARRIYLTGSPMREVLERQREQIDASTITKDLGYEPGGFFLVSAHRQENVDHPERLDQLLASLSQLGQQYDLPVLVSLHPRTRNRLGTEEASLLGFPAVTIRDSIERPEGLDTGSIILCGLDYESVAAAVSIVSDQAHGSGTVLVRTPLKSWHDGVKPEPPKKAIHIHHEATHSLRVEPSGPRSSHRNEGH